MRAKVDNLIIWASWC